MLYSPITYAYAILIVMVIALLIGAMLGKIGAAEIHGFAGCTITGLMVKIIFILHGGWLPDSVTRFSATEIAKARSVADVTVTIMMCMALIVFADAISHLVLAKSKQGQEG